MHRYLKTDYLIYTIVYVSVIIGMYYYFALGDTAFKERYAVEDGLIEYGTAIALCIAAIVLIMRGLRHHTSHSWLRTMTLILLGLLLIFGAGEEISWGQRIFGFDTPEGLSEINQQDEFNFHNIKVGEFDVNKEIFSKLFTVIIMAYFLLGPWLPAKWRWGGELVDRLWLPVPTWLHSFHFIIPALGILLIGSDKKWELLEFAFTMILLSVVLLASKSAPHSQAIT